MGKILEIFWRIYLSIIFWILLWMLTSLVIWNLNITVNTILKYCYKKALNKKLKLMGGVMKYFLKKLLVHELSRSMVSWATKFFWKICKILRFPPPCTYLMYTPWLQLLNTSHIFFSYKKVSWCHSVYNLRFHSYAQLRKN